MSSLLQLYTSFLRGCTILGFVGVLIFSGTHSWAEARETKEACFKLFSGENKPVCKVVLRNLNYNCSVSRVVCMPTIHPSLSKSLSVPRWEPVDVESHIEIVAQYIRIRAIVPINCEGQCEVDWREMKWQEYKPELLKRLTDGRIRFVRTRIHVKYDDEPTLAYRLVDTACSPKDLKTYEISRRPGLMIVDEKTGKPDSYYSQIHHFACYDVFLYQGDAFLLDLNTLRYAPVTPDVNSGHQYISHAASFRA